jgi:hypothetical protein
MNPQLAALQAAQAAALSGGLLGNPGISNLQLAAAQAAAQLAMPNYYGGNPTAAAAAAAAHAAAAAAAAVGGGGRMPGGRGDHGGSNGHHFDGRDGHDGRQRGGGGKGGRDRGGRRGERDHHRESQDESIAQYSARYQHLEDVGGQLMAVAQDQNGCRFLQRKFDEGGAAAIGVLFSELLDNVTSLMTDPFGNYLVQKLLDRCSEEQRLRVLERVAEQGQLVSVALNTHGTRAVQKLIETLTCKEQRVIAIEALKPGVVSLIKDLNGNHVVQRCLQRLGPEDSQFIYDAAKAHCVEIATHRHGCCVLQRCIDFATPDQKTELVQEVARHGLVLSQVRGGLELLGGGGGAGEDKGRCL